MYVWNNSVKILYKHEILGRKRSYFSRRNTWQRQTTKSSDYATHAKKRKLKTYSHCDGKNKP